MTRFLKPFTACVLGCVISALFSCALIIAVFHRGTPSHGGDRYQVVTDGGMILKVDRGTGNSWMLLKVEGTNTPAAWVPLPDVTPTR